MKWVICASWGIVEKAGVSNAKYDSRTNARPSKSSRDRHSGRFKGTTNVPELVRKVSLSSSWRNCGDVLGGVMEEVTGATGPTKPSTPPSDNKSKTDGADSKIFGFSGVTPGAISSWDVES
ncbi:MAG: hypothetical protein QXU73_05040 [Thermoplasmata archaeon]